MEVRHYPGGSIVKAGFRIRDGYVPVLECTVDFSRAPLVEATWLPQGNVTLPASRASLRDLILRFRDSVHVLSERSAT